MACPRWHVGRYAGSTETVLNQDLKAVDTHGVDGLMENLRAVRGDLTVRPEDFAGNSLGARFYPVLYLLTRTRRTGLGMAPCPPTSWASSADCRFITSSPGASLRPRLQPRAR